MSNCFIITSPNYLLDDLHIRGNNLSIAWVRKGDRSPGSQSIVLPWDLSPTASSVRRSEPASSDDSRPMSIDLPLTPPNDSEEERESPPFPPPPPTEPSKATEVPSLAIQALAMTLATQQVIPPIEVDGVIKEGERKTYLATKRKIERESKAEKVAAKAAEKFNKEMARRNKLREEKLEAQKQQEEEEEETARREREAAAREALEEREREQARERAAQLQKEKEEQAAAAAAAVAAAEAAAAAAAKEAARVAAQREAEAVLAEKTRQLELQAAETARRMQAAAAAQIREWRAKIAALQPLAGQMLEEEAMDTEPYTPSDAYTPAEPYLPAEPYVPASLSMITSTPSFSDGHEGLPDMNDVDPYIPTLASGQIPPTPGRGVESGPGSSHQDNRRLQEAAADSKAVEAYFLNQPLSFDLPDEERFPDDGQVIVGLERSEIEEEKERSLNNTAGLAQPNNRDSSSHEITEIAPELGKEKDLFPNGPTRVIPAEQQQQGPQDRELTAAQLLAKQLELDPRLHKAVMENTATISSSIGHGRYEGANSHQKLHYLDRLASTCVRPATFRAGSGGNMEPLPPRKMPAPQLLREAGRLKNPTYQEVFNSPQALLDDKVQVKRPRQEDKPRSSRTTRTSESSRDSSTRDSSADRKPRSPGRRSRTRK